jgi:hypothetical protein
VHITSAACERQYHETTVTPGGVFQNSTASDGNKQLLIWHALRNYLNAKYKQVRNTAKRPPGTVNVDEHPFSDDDGNDQDDVDDDDLEVTTLPTLKDLQIVGEHATTKEKASVVMQRDREENLLRLRDDDARLKANTAALQVQGANLHFRRRTGREGGRFGRARQAGSALDQDTACRSPRCRQRG